MFSLLCHLASAVVGALIPVFYSYKTIKRPSQKSLSYWSKYWAVFGSFLAIDAILTALFIHYFVPFYELGKLLFLIWAICPQTAGAQFLFDKVLAPFIRKHEKKMDIYVERLIETVIQNGPELAMTAGSTLLTVAKNLHALSRVRRDADGRLCLPAAQTVEIEEIVDDEEEPVPRAQPQPPPPPAAAVTKVEVERQSEDEVIFVPVPQRKEQSKSTSEDPAPAKRKRGRRPGSGVTRRTAKNQTPKVIQSAEWINDDQKVIEVAQVVEVVRSPSRRRRNTRAAASAAKKLFIVGDGDDTASEA